MKTFITLTVTVLASINCLAQLKPVKLDPSYEHDKWATQPVDEVFKFEAFTASFDGKDDNDGDGKEDIWGIPEWVAYEIKKTEKKHAVARPKWATDERLHKAGIAPADATYHIGGTKDLKAVKTDYRFVRGHMCPKDTAARISADAAHNTHILINAVPQLQWQNNGIWKALEDMCESWADKYGQVWVVCGPIFFEKKPSIWLGQDDEKKAAVPDALFKIVIREEDDSLETLAFIIPNVLPKEHRSPGDFQVAIEDVENSTGLSFLTKHHGIAAKDIKTIKTRKSDLADW